MSDHQKLDTYRMLNEDEFELEEFSTPAHPLATELRELAVTMLVVVEGLTKLADSIEEAFRATS